MANKHCLFKLIFFRYGKIPVSFIYINMLSIMTVEFTYWRIVRGAIHTFVRPSRTKQRSPAPIVMEFTVCSHIPYSIENPCMPHTFIAKTAHNVWKPHLQISNIAIHIQIT